MDPSSPIVKHEVLQPTLYAGCLFFYYSLLSTKHAQSRHSELRPGSQRRAPSNAVTFLYATLPPSIMAVQPEIIRVHSHPLSYMSQQGPVSHLALTCIVVSFLSTPFLQDGRTNSFVSTTVVFLQMIYRRSPPSPQSCNTLVSPMHKSSQARPRRPRP